MCKLRGKEADIIKAYKEGTRIAEIAEKHGVVDTTIQKLLHKMKVPVKRGDYKPRVSKYNMKKKKTSPGLLAQRLINTKINNNKEKGIQYIRCDNSIQDKRWIRNILNRPYMAV